jgi:hypothetical protein
MTARHASLKTASWRVCALTARRVYHQALVPMICAGMLCLVAISIVQASF